MSNASNASCKCDIKHEDILEFLKDEVDKVYLLRDRYFENRDICEAINKNSDVEKLMNETIKVFDDHEILALASDKAKYIYLRGKLLNVLPKYCRQSENLLSKAIKLDPKLIGAWNELGECYWKNDEIRKSINCFERTLKDNENKVAFRNLSMLARQEQCTNGAERIKNIKKGLELAKKAVEIDPQDGLSWVVLGNAHLSVFFGIQQNPNTLKQCLKAYLQAEKDLVAKSSPELHYNKGITLKYEEEFKLALESFENAIKYDPTWEPPRNKKKELLQYLNDIQEMVKTRGKMKPKRFQQILQSIDSKQLGPYGGGKYTSTTGYSIKLEQSKIKDLKEGLNDEKVILGKVVCSVRNEDAVPFTFCMVDNEGFCAVVTVFNLADGKGVIIGDSVAIPEPYVTDINFSHEGIDYDFRIIRVETPVMLIINSKKANRSLEAGVEMSIFNKN